MLTTQCTQVTDEIPEILSKARSVHWRAEDLINFCTESLVWLISFTYFLITLRINVDSSINPTYVPLAPGGNPRIHTQTLEISWELLAVKRPS